MLKMLHSRLLSSVAFAPPNEGTPGAGDQDGQQDDAPNGEQDQGEAGGADAGDDALDLDVDGDQGEGDDEPEGDDVDADADADLDAQGEQGGGRANRRITALRERSRALAEENARITRELHEARTRQQQQQTETPEQRAQRFALMAPEDRIREEMQEQLRASDQRQQQFMSALMEQNDQQSFNTLCASNPVIKKLSADVERRLADLRSKGQNLPRIAVATYLIGERVLQGQANRKPSGKVQQRSRPVNGGGEPPRRDRRSSGNVVQDFERRYGDVEI